MCVCVCVIGLEVLQALLYQPTCIVGCAMSTRSKGRVPDLDDCIRSLQRYEWSAYHVVRGLGASMPWITASAGTEWRLLQVHLGVTLGRHYFTRCETVSSKGGYWCFRPRACMHVHTLYILFACAYIPLPFQELGNVSKALDCYRGCLLWSKAIKLYLAHLVR